MVTGEDIRTLCEYLYSIGAADFVLTGTAGLYYHGLLPKGTDVHDIDVLLPYESFTALQGDALAKQEKLSGEPHFDYEETTGFTFKVGTNNVKVNVIVTKPNTIISYRTMSVNGGSWLKVEDAFQILGAKASLQRFKDYEFITKLINQLSGLLCLKK